MELRAPDGSVFRIRLSAGLAWLDAGTMSFDDWLQAADDALYDCKARGRNMVVIAPAARRPATGSQAGS